MIVFLIYHEVTYYLDSRLVFTFVPDTDLQSKLKVHIDLTVAMPCKCKSSCHVVAAFVIILNANKPYL